MIISPKDFSITQDTPYDERNVEVKVEWSFCGCVQKMANARTLAEALFSINGNSEYDTNKRHYQKSMFVHRIVNNKNIYTMKQ